MSFQKYRLREVASDFGTNAKEISEIVGKYFENNISLKRAGNGKGTMTIHFGSDEEVRRFLKALEDSNF